MRETNPGMWKSLRTPTPGRQAWWDWRHILWLWHCHGLHHVTSNPCLQPQPLSRAPDRDFLPLARLSEAAQNSVYPKWKYSSLEQFFIRPHRLSGTVNRRGLVFAYSPSSPPIGFLPGVRCSPALRAAPHPIHSSCLPVSRLIPSVRSAFLPPLPFLSLPTLPWFHGLLRAFFQNYF